MNYFIIKVYFRKAKLYVYHPHRKINFKSIRILNKNQIVNNF